MPKVVISDTSVLIIFHKVGEFEILILNDELPDTTKDINLQDKKEWMTSMIYPECKFIMNILPGNRVSAALNMQAEFF